MPFESPPRTEVCSTCHRALTRRGPSGECLRCLFTAGLPLADADAAQEEEDHYGHFEIVRAADGFLEELGQGAMGTTYRARDTVLNSTVALKVIGRDSADHPDARARFLREARAAARLRHPHVASVYHYGEQDGLCYYAMELVEGETLEARVRRTGPLPAAEALEIAAQVARALVAAEAQGIVHRDLKPGNLMLAATEEAARNPILVKVIDFGLAKAVVSDPAAPGGPGDTRGGFVGTPAFASPEQFARGEVERIDTRSDIYSLGVTLWYLLCGKTPFVAATLAQIQERQRQPLPLDQLHAARVPAPLVGLLRSMLSVDPAARPQSARELSAAIERCQLRLPARPRRARRVWTTLLASGLLATVAAAAFLRWHRPAGTARPPDRTVTVLPFENLSPDENVAFFTGGVQRELTSELARIAQLTVISADGAQSYPPGQRDLAAIGRALGAGHLVEGSVRRGGDALRVTVRLVDTHDLSHAWSKQYDGKVADVFAIQRAITREVATRLRVDLSAGEESALDRPPTADPLAYDLYLRAYQVGDQFKGPAALRKGMADKIALLDEAVARDPKFVDAYCMLSESHDEAAFYMEGATPEERAVDHRALAEIALDKARLIDPNSGGLHLAQAHRFLMILSRPEQALIDIDLARRTLPNSPDLEQIAGIIALRLGHWDDAVRTLERSNLLQPHSPVILGPLSWAYADLRRYDDEERVLSEVIGLRLASQSLPDRLNRALIPLKARGDLAPLRAVLKAATITDDDDRWQIAEFSLHLALLARDAAAMAEALKTAPPSALQQDETRDWYEGTIARFRGDEAAARQAFDAARREVEQRLASQPNNEKLISRLGLIDAMLGRKDEAVNEARRACETASQRKRSAIVLIAMSCRLATVYAWTDQPDQAFAVLNGNGMLAASNYGSAGYQLTYGDLLLNPIWDPLRGDPRFAELTRRLAPEQRLK